MEKSAMMMTSTFDFKFNAEKDINERIMLAIRNGQVELLGNILHECKNNKKDLNVKELVLCAAYQKSPLCLLLLLRTNGPSEKSIQTTEKDDKGKNIYHYITMMGSLHCLEVVIFYNKLCKIKKAHEQFLFSLKKYGYKRTDAKEGQLRYSVSAKRQIQFQQLQTEVAEIYKKYLNSYLNEVTNCLKKGDKHGKNPLHYGCLNKYQKCLPTLQELLSSLDDPNIKITYERISQMETINLYFPNEKIDCRNFSQTLSSLEQVLLPETLNEIKKNYSKTVKAKINEVLKAKDESHQSALHIASQNGSTAMINFLHKNCPQTQQKQKQEIIKVASNNLTRSHIINLCDASKLKDTVPLNFLISCGEKVNQKKTIFGTFPLLAALQSFQANSHSTKPFEALIKSGADVNIQDTNGWTVLHHACFNGYKQIVQLLLNNPKTDINKITSKRYHALHLASMNDHPNIIHILKSKPSVNINFKDWDGMTALMHAAKKGSLKALKQLLNLKADIYLGDVRNMTALHHAAFSNQTQIIKELLYYDSDFDKLKDMRNTKGKLARDLCTDTSPFNNIFTASRTGDVNLIRKFTTQNSELINSVTRQKERTPLILAVLAKSLISVKFLIDIGANKGICDESQKSAIQYCDQCLSTATKQKNTNDIKVLKQIEELLN